MLSNENTQTDDIFDEISSLPIQTEEILQELEMKLLPGQELFKRIVNIYFFSFFTKV